jgi:hypothetical protein
LAEKYPESEIDVWCLVALFTSGNPTSVRRFFDEHRVGLKPILRKVWAEIGKRPIAAGNHGYEWLDVYGFVNPKTGETL